MRYLDWMTQESSNRDGGLLESAARWFDRSADRSCPSFVADAQPRLEWLANEANEGNLTLEEAREYDCFIEFGDIIATLRFKGERQRRREIKQRGEP